MSWPCFTHSSFLSCEVTPDPSIEVWSRAYLPVGHESIWGEGITDFGEGTGSPADTMGEDAIVKVAFALKPKRPGFMKYQKFEVPARKIA